MFKLAKERRIKNWPTTVVVPQDNGKTAESKIKLDLLLLNNDETNKLMREGDKALFKKVITGWHGLGDEEGNELPFTEENLAAAAVNPHFAQAALQAYLQASSGQAQEKN